MRAEDGGGFGGVLLREADAEGGGVTGEVEDEDGGVALGRDEAAIAVDGVDGFNLVLEFFGHCSASEGLCVCVLRD